MSDTAEWQDYNGRNVKDTIIHFYDKEVQHSAKSLEAGRPIYETRTFIQKITPGDTHNKIDREIRDRDKLDFADEWRKYVAQEKNEVVGTPLEAWPQITRAQALEMRALNIMTVEHLANLSDQHGMKIMGFYDLKRKAKNFLKAASDSSLFDKITQESEEKDAQLKEQAEAIKALQAQMAELSKPKKKGRISDAA
jgi:hypothetical protein